MHKNDMGSFALDSVAYALDGAPITRTDKDGDLSKRPEFEIFNGRIVPGQHQIAVRLIYRGKGFGVFSYLEGYKFTVSSSYTFSAEPGKVTTVKVVGYEKGGITTDLKDSRPSATTSRSTRGGAEARARRNGGDEAEAQPPAQGTPADWRAVPRRAVRLGPAAVLLVLVAVEMPALAAEVRVSASTAAKLDQVSAQLRNATENLGVVETQYATRADPSNDLVLERRFSDGEIQSILQDWPTAPVLFYDLLSDKAFDANPRRPDALSYHTHPLYHQRATGAPASTCASSCARTPRATARRSPGTWTSPPS